MSVTLDASSLKTPPSERDILIEPPAARFSELSAQNIKHHQDYTFRVCGVPFADYRRQVRQAADLPADQTVVAMGHQPEFHHCGVWAKSLVGQITVQRLGGATAVNVMIDHDRVRQRHLPVPYVEQGHVRLSHLPIDSARRAELYEQLPPWSPAQIAGFRQGLERALQDRWRPELLAVLVESFATAPAAVDWVAQYVYAHKKIDVSFGVSQLVLRSSRLDYGCFLGELIGQAERFAASYNKSLGAYRRAQRIKGNSHPVPDLYRDDHITELPVWVVGRDHQRRRLHVQRSADRLVLLADRNPLEDYPARDFRDWNTARSHIDDLTTTYALRPRALTFTLWARLFLSDFFIHGIGGAKYDHITDRLIRDYFGCRPPSFSCVSATLWLDLPRYGVGRDDIVRHKRLVRDITTNPQRHAVLTAESRELIRQREDRVCKSQRLRQQAPQDHDARRRVFEDIRALNQDLLRFCDEPLSTARRQLAELQWQAKSDALATSREYYYGLFPKKRLQALQDRCRQATE